MAVFMKSCRILAMGNVKCRETRHPGAEESANYCRTRCADSYALYLTTVVGESPVPFRARSGARLRQPLDSRFLSCFYCAPLARCNPPGPEGWRSHFRLCVPVPLS